MLLAPSPGPLPPPPAGGTGNGTGPLAGETGDSHASESTTTSSAFVSAREDAEAEAPSSTEEPCQPLGFPYSPQTPTHSAEPSPALSAAGSAGAIGRHFGRQCAVVPPPPPSLPLDEPARTSPPVPYYAGSLDDAEVLTMRRLDALAMAPRPLRRAASDDALYEHALPRMGRMAAPKLPPKAHSMSAVGSPAARRRAAATAEDEAGCAIA
mmetsp:Transcript_46721/g.122705  ORF Transcript_46721/g.122705 Transcript_46721/m.122705 type:complete len:210 (+) Transcript_46721:1-630(+)